MSVMMCTLTSEGARAPPVNSNPDGWTRHRLGLVLGKINTSNPSTLRHVFFIWKCFEKYHSCSHRPICTTWTNGKSLKGPLGQVPELFEQSLFWGGVPRMPLVAINHAMTSNKIKKKSIAFETRQLFVLFYRQHQKRLSCFSTNSAVQNLRAEAMWLLLDWD